MNLDKIMTTLGDALKVDNSSSVYFYIYIFSNSIVFFLISSLVIVLLYKSKSKKQEELLQEKSWLEFLPYKFILILLICTIWAVTGIALSAVLISYSKGIIKEISYNDAATFFNAIIAPSISLAGSIVAIRLANNALKISRAQARQETLSSIREDFERTQKIFLPIILQFDDLMLNTNELRSKTLNYKTIKYISSDGDVHYTDEYFFDVKDIDEKTFFDMISAIRKSFLGLVKKIEQIKTNPLALACWKKSVMRKSFLTDAAINNLDTTRIESIFTLENILNTYTNVVKPQLLLDKNVTKDNYMNDIVSKTPNADFLPLLLQIAGKLFINQSVTAKNIDYEVSNNTQLVEKVNAIHSFNLGQLCLFFLYISIPDKLDYRNVMTDRLEILDIPNQDDLKVIIDSTFHDKFELSSGITLDALNHECRDIMSNNDYFSLIIDTVSESFLHNAKFYKNSNEFWEAMKKEKENMESCLTRDQEEY